MKISRDMPSSIRMALYMSLVALLTMCAIVLSVMYFHGHNKVEEVAEEILDLEWDLPIGTVEEAVKILDLEDE